MSFLMTIVVTAVNTTLNPMVNIRCNTFKCPVSNTSYAACLNAVNTPIRQIMQMMLAEKFLSAVFITVRV